MKSIKYFPEEREQILSAIKAQLFEGIRTDKFSYSCPEKSVQLQVKIDVEFTENAYLKMRSLVNNSARECGWHGTVIISPNRKHFTITDILVYPQVVSASFIDVDEEKYEPWHQALDNDTYNTLRLQGHSHVNMAVTPSSTDKQQYEDTVQVLNKNSFYIFMITNKRKEYWLNIYDLKNNVLYESKDIRVLIPEQKPEDEWFKQMEKEYITVEAPTYYHKDTKTKKKEKKETTFIDDYDDYHQTYLDKFKEI